MDESRVDALARSLTQAGSRRFAVGTLLISAVALVGSRATAAKKRKGGGKKGKRKKKGCPPCKKKKDGKCTGNQPFGALCESGSCDGAGTCISPTGSVLPPSPLPLPPSPLPLPPPPGICPQQVCCSCDPTAMAPRVCLLLEEGTDETTCHGRCQDLGHNSAAAVASAPGERTVECDPEQQCALLECSG
jgi:hypothetical protein